MVGFCLRNQEGYKGQQEGKNEEMKVFTPDRVRCIKRPIYLEELKSCTASLRMTLDHLSFITSRPTIIQEARGAYAAGTCYYKRMIFDSVEWNICYGGDPDIEALNGNNPGALNMSNSYFSWYKKKSFRKLDNLFFCFGN